MISVLLPVRNGARYLREALDSILAQTAGDFELIVIDDASTDATRELLAATHDPRLTVIRNDRQRGIAGSLNRGWPRCRGEFIARMDADDISAPQRFERQLAFLEAHPEVGVCGTWVRMFADDWHRDRELETDPERIRCSLVLRNVLSHPSAMLRRSLFARHALTYDESFGNSEDYDLWSRASHCFALATIPEFLLFYRVHDEQVGRLRGARYAEVRRVHEAQLARLGAQFTDAQLAFHRAVAFGEPRDDANREDWLNAILDANARSRLYDADVLRDVLVTLSTRAAPQSPPATPARTGSNASR
ncbi:MAG TPA: glycosyltransferase [Thermoanaerobaculia bacterium]|nr:glycosyltransferase [Thermoanaerobaculia bacterium]